MLSSGSALSGQRKIHGAKTMANELDDMRLFASSLHTLRGNVLGIRVFIAACRYSSCSDLNTVVIYACNKS